MKLCMSLIKDEIPFPSVLMHPEEKPSIERYAFYRNEQTLEKDLVYVAYARDLPEKIVFQNGAALISVGDPAHTSINKRLPVLVLSEEVDILALANALGAAFQKYNCLEQKMYELLNDGRGLQEMTSLMCPFFGNELSVVDAGHRVQAHSFIENSSHDIPAVHSFEGKNMVPLEIISFFANNKRWVELRTETEPFIYDEGIFDYKLLCINIMGEHSFAWRVMLADSDQEFRPYDIHLLEFFVSFVQRVYRGHLATRDTRGMDNLKDILHLMLMGDQIESWRVKHSLSVAGHACESSFLCVCIRPRYWDDSAESLTYFCHQLWTLFPGIIALEFTGDIVCLIDLKNYESPEKFTEIITPFVRDNNFRIGISEPFESVMYFKEGYTQADIALTFGIADAPSIWVHRFHDQAVGYIVRKIGEEVGVRTLCAECVKRLQDYDVKNGSDYLETMECFFRHHLNISATSKALNIHRATVVYRLNRIEQLSGIDFQNAEKNLYYQLSIKLLKLMD